MTGIFFIYIIQTDDEACRNNQEQLDLLYCADFEGSTLLHLAIDSGVLKVQITLSVVCESVPLYFICLSVYLSVCLSVSLCLSIYLFVCLSVCLCVYLSVCLSARLSVISAAFEVRYSSAPFVLQWKSWKYGQHFPLSVHPNHYSRVCFYMLIIRLSVSFVLPCFTTLHLKILNSRHCSSLNWTLLIFFICVINAELLRTTSDILEVLWSAHYYQPCHFFLFFVFSSHDLTTSADAYRIYAFFSNNWSLIRCYFPCFVYLQSKARSNEPHRLLSPLCYTVLTLIDPGFLGNAPPTPPLGKG